MSGPPLHVAFIWHMHQPYYQDDLTRTVLLPWVRLRCAKDYLKMIDLLEAHPGLRQTFNLVPSLVDQIQHYLTDAPLDVYGELTQRPAGDLNEEERVFLLRFMAESSQIRRVRQYPRYLELVSKKERGGDLREIARSFSEGELRDLQVWFNLSWVDPRYLQAPPLDDLVARGRDFAEKDKGVVLEAQRDLMRRVLPRYRGAYERGQIELITSPYYHPILPLLYQGSLARGATPEVTLPRKSFSYPEDVEAQLQRGVTAFGRQFGAAPRGLWPPEAAVSEEILPAVARLQLQWLISDETVLARSADAPIHRDSDGHVMRPEALYRPYRMEREGAAVTLLFRDARLSNLIGFEYQHYPAEQAAQDLIGRLHAIRLRQDPAGPPLLVTIALDGENCWEFYEQNGNPFLSTLYQQLEREESLVPTTVSVFLAEHAAAHELGRIVPGSWIDGALTTWIGDREHNRAWDLLKEARSALENANQRPESDLAQARNEILIAEGSDWFWWFGRSHDSGIDVVWDSLFRLHLRNAYRLLGQRPPAGLFQPINDSPANPAARRPDRNISPRMEAGVLDEAEWKGAGYLDATALFGALHPPRGMVKRVWFGSDDQQLYLRFDPFSQPVAHSSTLYVFLAGGLPANAADLAWSRFEAPTPLREFGFDPQWLLTIEVAEAGATGRLSRLRESMVSEPVLTPRVETRPTLLCAIPFSALGSVAGESLQLAVAVQTEGRTVEVLPPSGSIKLRVPGDALRARALPSVPLKVLVVAAEVTPFAKVGGLADVAGALPKELKRLGHDVRVVMPRYGTIDPQKYALEVAGLKMPVPLALQRLPADVLVGTLGAGVPTYFIENQQFFGREGMYGFWDDDARFIYFSRAALEMCKLLDFRPDVIHVNDWHTAVIPNILARVYAEDSFFADTATVLTIHNLAYQGVFGYGTLHLANLEQWGLIKPGIPALDDIVNLLGRGIFFADAVNTVSHRYAEEILTPTYGEKMDPLLRVFRHKLFGILNGIDYEVFNPATDPHLAITYDAASPERKGENKIQLQRQLGLPASRTTPVIALISRLYDQKGLDLIANLMWGLMRLPIQLVVLGAGDGRYEEMFRTAARDHPQRVAATIGFRPVLAQQIYAGADFFLMPSRFEPCGLGQLISLRYGTIPIVRATGGLDDTVEPFEGSSGTGFKFSEYSPIALLTTLRQALETYRQPKQWQRLMQNCMKKDFSWASSAKQYAKVYEGLNKARGKARAAAEEDAA